MKWQNLSSKTVYTGRYMTVTEDEVVTNHGDHLTYGIVHKDPFAIIIPWDGERLLIVGQYRYAIDTFSWEFPMGHSEKEHINIEDTAKIELKEETGIKAGKIEEIGTFYLAPGHHTQIAHIFLATNHEQGERQLEASEKDMQLKWVSIPELSEMIQKGELKDGITITSLKFFELYLASPT